MKRIYTLSLLLGLLACLWFACKRNDAEPDYPASPISRLYISYSDIESSDTDPFKNISVIDPADSADYWPANTYGYDSDPNQGMGIVFDPYIGRGFQISRLDSSVMSFTVAENGTLSSSTNFRDTVRLHSARAVRYNRASDHLIISDDYPDTPSIQLFYNPVRLAQQQRAQYRAFLEKEKRPWGLTLSNESDSTLIVSMVGSTRQIWIFGINDLKTNDSSTITQPRQKISIANAIDLRGLTYSKTLNMLFIADIGEVAGPGETSKEDGKIYIIENARETLQTGGTITPNRIITGAPALIDPTDVAVDDRRGRPNFIYVSDRGNRRLYRYPIDANGEAEPNAPALTLPQSLPEFIYLDARGGESADGAQ